jgi:type II secretory pathway predicted ATPase ExeA
MYLEYFGFREKPFNVTPDPRFFYSNPIYQETYAGLLYGIRERKGFISLIGEVGTGKTTLLRKLMAELREPIHFVYVCYTTLTFEELLSFICADLGLTAGEKSHLQRIQSLNDFLIEVSKEGGTGVLLVDEAQNLGDDVLENLRLLSNLETASEKLLQIVLVGQPELERKLAQPKLRQLKQRIAIQGRLGRLKEREVGPFISSRLAAVGYEGKELFAPETLQRIAVYSKGTPRLINVICDNALLVAYSLNQTTVPVEIIEEVARDLQLRAEPRGARIEESSVEGRDKGEKQESSRFDDHQSEDLFDIGPQSRVAQIGSSSISQRRTLTSESHYPTWRTSRIIVGTVLVLALLGGAGAAIFPGPGSFGLFGIAHRISEWFEAEQNPAKEEREHGVSPLVPDSPVFSKELNKQDKDGIEESVASAQEPDKSGNGEKGQEGEVNGRSSVNLSKSVTSPPVGKVDSITVEPGMSIFALILKTYGTYNTLAIDLVRENNPHIKDLEKIVVGEKIWLPPLSQETLVREEPNGRYRLILASFRKQQEAEQFAQTVREKGYVVTVTPRQIIHNMLLRRVEIEELKNIDEVKTAWNLFDVENRLSRQAVENSSGLASVANER